MPTFLYATNKLLQSFIDQFSSAFILMLKPWITNDILRKCNGRDSLLKDIKTKTDQVKIESLRKDHKFLRNKITQEKRDSKNSPHYSAYFEK